MSTIGEERQVNSIIHLLLFLLVAAICAGIASAIIPGAVPGGFLSEAIIGVIGAWLGTRLIGHLGPDLAGVALLPAIIGSAVLILVLTLLSNIFAWSGVTSTPPATNSNAPATTGQP